MRDIDADRALVDDVTGTTFGQRVRGIEAAEVKAHEKEEMGIILRARGELEHLIDSRSPNQIKEGLDESIRSDVQQNFRKTCERNAFLG